MLPVAIASGLYWLVSALAPQTAARLTSPLKIFAVIQILGLGAAILTLFNVRDADKMNRPMLEIFDDGFCYYPEGNNHNRFLAWQELRIADTFEIASNSPYNPPIFVGRRATSYLPLLRKETEEIRLPLERLGMQARDIRVLLGRHIEAAMNQPRPQKTRQCTTLPE